MRIWEEQNSGGKLQVKNRKCNMDQQSKKRRKNVFRSVRRIDFVAVMAGGYGSQCVLRG